MKFLITLFFALSTLLLTAQIERADSIKAAEYTIKSLEANSKYADFGSTYFGKNKIVFSSSRKKGGVSNKTWKKNGQPYLDLYIGDVTSSGDITNIKPFSPDVNSKYHDAFVAFSPDLKDVYFSSNNYMHKKLKSENIKIFKAKITDNGRWKNFITLPFNNDKYDTGHPVFNKDGTKMYFVSNMPGTLGDKDIFVVDVKEGHYGKPINLGPTINSSAKEYTPFIDGDVIYFASNRKGGFGGFDIYMAKLDGSLPEPINLGQPINSRADDFAFIIDNDKLKGYFSSNRVGGHGDDDMYSFVQKTTIPICNQIISGVIKDNLTRLPLANAFVALIDSEGNQLRKEETLGDGVFYFNLKCGSPYTLQVTKKGFFETDTRFRTSQINGFKNEEVIYIKEREFIRRGNLEMLNIESIKFEINSSEIKEESKRLLDKVVRLMKKYPKMKIEFGVHTDSRGPDDFNLSLTQQRASATEEYLLTIGVESNRLSSKGFGETVPLNNCVNGVKCTNLEYLLNKRTEFIVITR